jgi:predicted ATPase/DNA-binding SARP family transcriptional activator
MLTKGAGPAPPGPVLPSEWTSFVGRDAELDQVTRLLSAARLLTLTGAGGSGKTRLAREIVARGEGGDGGFAWVELAPLEDPELIPRQVAAGFGIAEEVRSPEGLVDLLRARTALVVLDNCEHLVDACAETAHALLAGCPGIRILATSREALGVKGERSWRVPPLAVPDPGADPEEIGEAEAVRLFMDRARDASPGFELTPAHAPVVSEICRRLDGIPLALELAAARIKVLAPAQIRDRLDDAFRILSAGGRTAIPRHRTLRAAIDWSHDLLPPLSQLLFRRLAVFRGGFTLDAAEAVCSGDGMPADQVLEEVARLVDRSLLGFREEGDGARYALLETVRQYAAGRLAESGEEGAVRERQARFLAGRIAALEPLLTTTRRRETLEGLLPEMDNLREALLWTREHDPETHVRLVGGMWWFWYSTRHWVEAGTWIHEALALPPAAVPGTRRAALLFAAGALAALQAQPAAARPLLEEAAALAGQAGEERLEAYALNYLGMAHTQAMSQEGREPSERAAAWFRAQGDDYGLRLALLLLGLSAYARGDGAAALAITEEAVAVARRFGQDRELAVSLQNLALVHLTQDRVEQAEALLMESCAASRRDPSYLFVATSLDSLGEVRVRQGRPLEAARILGAAAAIREAIGANQFPITRARLAPLVAGLKAGAQGEAFDRHWAAGGQLSVEAILEEVLEAAGPAAAAAPPQATAPVPVPASTAEYRAASASGSAPPAELPVPASPASTVPVAPAGVVPASDAVDLRIRTLGPLRVHLQGSLLDGGAWSYAKPRELLVYLALHPIGRTRDEIGRAIWPGASAAQVKNSFHVSLHHLRKTLGDAAWVVTEGDRYRLSPDLTVEVDADGFDREARAALRNGADPSRLARVRAEYAGDFLEGEMVGPWHEEHRDRLRRLWVDVSLRLAASLEEAGDDAGAAALFHEVAVREELNEEAHRGVMRTWSRLGDRPRALRHYARLVELLRDELDSEPEPETVAAADRIRVATPA